MVGKMALMWPKRILKCSGERWPWSIGRVSLGEAQNPGAITLTGGAGPRAKILDNYTDPGFVNPTDNNLSVVPL